MFTREEALELIERGIESESVRNGAEPYSLETPWDVLAVDILATFEEEHRDTS